MANIVGIGGVPNAFLVRLGVSTVETNQDGERPTFFFAVEIFKIEIVKTIEILEICRDFSRFIEISRHYRDFLRYFRIKNLDKLRNLDREM